MAKSKNIVPNKRARYKGRDAYSVKDQRTGHTAYFDRDPVLLARIVNEKESTTLYFDRSKNAFIFDCDTKSHRSISLEEFIRTFYDGEHDSRVKRVEQPIGKRFNCFRDNLYCETDIVPDNASRAFQIAEDGKSFTIKLKQSGLVDRASYSSELWKFLTKPSNFSFDADKGRIVVHWKNSTGKQDSCLLSVLCYAFYREGVTEDNFRIKMAEVKAKMREPGNDDPNYKLQIDHLNDDHHNHCVWNLSCIPKIKNQTKSEYFARIKRPYFLYGAVTEDNQYRLVFGCNEDIDTTPFHTKPFTWREYYTCSSVDTLIEFLSQLKDIDSRLWGAGKNESIKKQWGDGRRYAPHPAKIYERAQNAAEDLLSRPKDDFTVFTTDHTLVVRSTFDVA